MDHWAAAFVHAARLEAAPGKWCFCVSG